MYLFKQNQEKLADFSRSLGELKTGLRYCADCYNISEEKKCRICSDSSRNKSIICVVEDPLDVIAIERTKKYNGLYHVLGGLLGPIEREEEKKKIKFSELENRIGKENIQEVILATNPTTEGDATALYIKRLLGTRNVKITRLARGLSTGGDIEYADELTLGSAIDNRK